MKKDESQRKDLENEIDLSRLEHLTQRAELMGASIMHKSATMRMYEEMTRASQVHKPAAVSMYEEMMRVNEMHKPAAERMYEEMMRSSEVHKPAAVSMYEEMERSLETIKRQQTELEKAKELSRISSPWHQDINRAAMRMSSLISLDMTAHSEGLQRAHGTWKEMFGKFEDKPGYLQTAANVSLLAATKVATISEQLYSRLEFDTIRQAKAISFHAISSIEHSIANVTAGYERLGRSLQTLSDVTQLPSFALPGAASEVFISGYAAKQVCFPSESEVDKPEEEKMIAEIKKEVSGSLALLQSINPALVLPYIGANDALHSNNADRARHILSSLRELWNHLLRHLAPDEMVLKWLPEDRKDFMHQGRPTRKARVLYVCRNLNHAPLSDFVVQDTHALVKLIEFFNRVHELEPKMTDLQLKALLLRTESWIMYLLKIEEASKYE